MVPRVTSKGKSFKGAGQYFLHDLGKAQTSERVAFTHTVNMLTDDPEKALKVMAWTAEHAQELKAVSGQKLTGRKAENPVYNYCLAWAPDQNPDQAHMIEFGLRSLEALGVSEHEVLFIAHDDTDHKHLHIMVNRVHPVTGLMAKMDHDQNRLSRLAQAYEEETGQIYCLQRVFNNQRRELGEKYVIDQSRDNRQAQSPEYLARRTARIEAQKQAAVAHAEKTRKAQHQTELARDLRAEFDNQTARDDRQYRARELDRPVGDERVEARTAWEDERAKERQRGKEDRDKVRLAQREQHRRAWLDQKRAAEWTAYEAKVLQGLNDRQTTQREGLRDIQAERRRRFDERLERKYSLAETTLQRRIEAVAAELCKKGARAVIDRITGSHAHKEAQLRALEQAAQKLQEQKTRERVAYEAKQQQQRAEQAKRQEAERRSVGERLDNTRARQDAKFAEREAERARRIPVNDRARTDPKALEQQRETEAQRAAVREDLDSRARDREERARQSSDLGAAFGQEAGLGLGLSR